MTDTPAPSAPAAALAEPDWLGTRFRMTRRYRLHRGIPMVVEVEAVKQPRTQG